jgi:hypothetical protein
MRRVLAKGDGAMEVALKRPPVIQSTSHMTK